MGFKDEFLETLIRIVSTTMRRLTLFLHQIDESLIHLFLSLH